MTVISNRWKEYKGEGYTIKTERSRGTIHYVLYRKGREVTSGSFQGTVKRFIPEVIEPLGLTVYGEDKIKKAHTLSEMIKYKAVLLTSRHTLSTMIEAAAQAILEYGKYRALPSVHEVVSHPVDGLDQRIERIIFDLLDNHGYTIADVCTWLETEGY